RQFDIVAGAADVRDRKFITAHGNGRAFREAVEGAGNRVGQIVVDDREFLSNADGRGEGRSYMQHGGGKSVCAAPIELIVISAGDSNGKREKVELHNSGDTQNQAGER